MGDELAKVLEALRLIGPTAFSSGDAHARFVELTKEEDPATPAEQADGIPAPASVTDQPTQTTATDTSATTQSY